MGVDLKLLPVVSPRMWISNDMLQLNRSSELWSKIRLLPQKDVPEPIHCYLAIGEGGDPEYGCISRDLYNESLKWTTPADLLTLKNDVHIKDNWENRAIWAWLSEMPPDWPIVLYWC